MDTIGGNATSAPPLVFLNNKKRLKYSAFTKRIESDEQNKMRNEIQRRELQEQHIFKTFPENGDRRGIPDFRIAASIQIYLIVIVKIVYSYQ